MRQRNLVILKAKKVLKIPGIRSEGPKWRGSYWLKIK